jgi:hypothetical protein
MQPKKPKMKDGATSPGRPFLNQNGLESHVFHSKDLSIGKKQHLMVQDVIRNLVEGKKL